MEKFEVGDIVSTKKPHACGGERWEVVRAGADVKIKCLKCGHIVMIGLDKFLKFAKKEKKNG